MSTTPTAATAGRTTTTQVYRVYIKATPQAIWDAITQPEWTARYGYTGYVDFDLRAGGHFIAYERPEEFVEDVRAFFRDFGDEIRRGRSR